VIKEEEVLKGKSEKTEGGASPAAKPEGIQREESRHKRRRGKGGTIGRGNLEGESLKRIGWCSIAPFLYFKRIGKKTGRIERGHSRERKGSSGRGGKIQ